MLTKTKVISLENITEQLLLLHIGQQYLWHLFDADLLYSRSIPRRTSILWKTTSLNTSSPPHPISESIRC